MRLRPQRSTFLLWLVGQLLLACDSPVGPADEDGEAPEDASDASMIPDADAAPRDAMPDVPDVSTMPDADSSIPCTCEASSPCLEASCDESGACVETPITDGTACADEGASICVQGACVVRACGDGYLEPGPTPAREACDDGNVETDDACSATCTPQLFVVDEEFTETYAARPAAPRGVGVDGKGGLLFVGTRDYGGTIALVARRANAGAAFLQTNGSDFITLDVPLASVESASPAVMGLPQGGWVVAWGALRAGTLDIVARVIAADGTFVTSTVVVNDKRTGTQAQPSIAVVGNEIIIAFTDRHPTVEDPFGGVRARRFSLLLDPIAPAFDLATSRENAEHSATLAVVSTTWIAAWVREGGSLATPGISARRFSGGVALDLNEGSLANAANADTPLLATRPGSSEVGVLVRAFAADGFGDLWGGVANANDLTQGVLWPMLPAMAAYREVPSGLALSPTSMDGYAVYERGTPSRVALLHLTSAEDPELMELTDALASGGYDSASVVSGPQGYLVTWSGTLPGHADRCSLAYSIPYGVHP